MESSSTEKFPTFNILLLGETGVGKSTFINAFFNYLNYGRLTEAEQEELLFLVSTSFTVSDEDFNPRKIQVGNSANEEQAVGASATQNPVNYFFNIGHANIRLIDTPGIGDTRGADQDNINFDKLLVHIAELNELRAICILMKPNEARLTVMFEYCIKQLLSRLEKSASQNIIFMFTNTRGTNYRPGETLPSLMTLLECTEKKPPFVKIPLSKNNIFCIDNEAFRFLLILKNGIQCSEVEKMSFMASWKQSSDECLRMITYVAQLTPHKVQNTVSINEARRLIVHLSQPLADIAELIQKNIAILQRKKDELQNCSDDLEKLKKNLYIPVVNLKIDELKNPRTVCTATKCCKVFEIDGEEKFHYEKSCCDPCYLPYLPLPVIGAKELIFCQSMLSRTENLGESLVKGVTNLFKSFTGHTDQIECTMCGCSYKYHKHIYYQSSPYEDKIVDGNVESQLKNKESAKTAAERLVQDIETRSREYENEQDIINKSTAKFAHFLQNNAITPYNDAYEYFLQYTIDREKSNGVHADRKKIRMFENMLLCYKEEKKILDRALEKIKRSDVSTTSYISAADIMEAVRQLYDLPYCGAKIKEMFNKQAQARKDENKREREVKVKSKKRGGIFQRMYNTMF